MKDNFRLEKSYKAYVRMYGEWQEKGYAMYDLMDDIEKYKKLYDLATARGDSNIARTIAGYARQFTAREARTIAKNIRERTKEPELKQRYGDWKDIIGYNRDESFDSESEEDIEDYWGEAQSGKQAIYFDLRRAGYTREEAEQILYG